jgi:hypothetical protein
VAPLSIKFRKRLAQRIRVVVDGSKTLGPGSAGILPKAFPHQLVNMLRLPVFMVKHNLIARDPNDPQSKSLNQSPKAQLVLGSVRRLGGEERVLPMKVFRVVMDCGTSNSCF